MTPKFSEHGISGGERSLPTLTQLVVSRRRGCGGAWDRRKSSSLCAAAKGRSPGGPQTLWLRRLRFKELRARWLAWVKPFFLNQRLLDWYLTSLSGKTKTFGCSFVSYRAGKVLSGGLRPARKSEFTFPLKNHTHKQACLWREQERSRAAA